MPNRKSSFIGWETLKLDRVLATVSKGLGVYKSGRPALKLQSRRYNLEDDVTKWHISSKGVSFGWIKLSKGDQDIGVQLSYGLPTKYKKTDLKIIKRELYNFCEYIKHRLDSMHRVGTCWKHNARNMIPKSIEKQKEWLRVYKLIKGQEQTYNSYWMTVDAESHVVLKSEMLRYLKKEGVTYGIRTLQDIKSAGNKGYLDHIEDY